MRLLALALFCGLAFADEGEEMGRRVQALLRAHQSDVFTCVQAETKEPEGEMLVRVFVGEEDKPGRVDVLKDQTHATALARCISDKVRVWDLASLKAARGDQIVFPLAFHGENPFRIHGEAPKTPGKVQPTILWSGGGASMTLLKLGPSVRLAPHTHPSSEAVYVIKGMLRVRQNGKQDTLKAGEAAWFAADQPHSLEAAPLAPVELVQVFAPAVPEVAYLDHKAGGTTPSKKNAEKPVWLATASKPYSIKDGSVKLFLDNSGAPIALDEITADSRATIPPHKHGNADELLYILEGKGTTTIGEKSFPIGAGDAVRIPANTMHALAVEEKLVAVQIYSPGGPEQRFKQK